MVETVAVEQSPIGVSEYVPMNDHAHRLYIVHLQGHILGVPPLDLRSKLGYINTPLLCLKGIVILKNDD